MRNICIFLDAESNYDVKLKVFMSAYEIYPLATIYMRNKSSHDIIRMNGFLLGLNKSLCYLIKILQINNSLNTNNQLKSVLLTNFLPLINTQIYIKLN